MPYNTRCDVFGKLFLNCHRSKHLLITHYMLLVSNFNLSINLTLHLYIRNTVSDDKQQTFRRTHGRNYPVRGRVCIQIGLIFRCCVNNLIIKITQYSQFNSRIYVFIRIVFVVRRNRLIGGIFFSETIKRRVLSRSGAIECTLNRYNSSFCIVLHIIGENHQLRQIYETAEFLIRKSLSIHSCAFSDHTTVIVRFLHFDKCQR